LKKKIKKKIAKKSLKKPSRILAIKKNKKKPKQIVHKLSLKHQLFICASLVTGYSASVIVSLVQEKYGIKINRSVITNHYMAVPKWKKKTARMRTFYEAHYMKHPLASKLNRLNILQNAINEAMEWRLHKFESNEKGKTVRIEKRNINIVSGLVREARTEIEGEKKIGINITDNSKTVFQNVKIEGRSDEDLINDISKRLSSQHIRKHKISR